MKRVLALILAAVLALGMTACGGESSQELKKTDQVAAEPVDEAASPEEETVASEAMEETPPELEASIQETVLVDESGIKITAKSLDPESLFGPELKLLIENTSGKNLTVQCRGASVNGYMVETMMSVDVVDGKKANDSLTFMRSDLELCGITTIAEMEFSFHIFTTDEWEDYLDTDPIVLKTSAADSYQQPVDDSGDTAYEADGIRIVVKGLSEDDFLGPSIVVFIENTSGQSIMVQARDVSINGFMVEPIFSAEVISGKKAVSSITFMNSELEENEITAIETVELSFYIFDSSTWNDIVNTELVQIVF